MIKCDPRAKAKCPFKNPCCGDDVAYFVEGSECDEFNRKVLAPPPTNADRIRAMSDEELADMLAGFCEIADNCYGCPMNGNCAESGTEIMWYKWLQQPAEDDGHA